MIEQFEERGRVTMQFRESGPEERVRVNAFYQLTTYKRPVSPEDTVFVAEQEGVIVGAVRIEGKEGVQVLRGMYLLPRRERQGIGSQLLSAIASQLSKTDAYCIPFAHLPGFYSQIGFSLVEAEQAPAFLAERLEGYLDEGKRVVMMHREAGVFKPCIRPVIAKQDVDGAEPPAVALLFSES